MFFILGEHSQFSLSPSIVIFFSTSRKTVCVFNRDFIVMISIEALAFNELSNMLLISLPSYRPASMSNFFEL